MKYLIRYKTLCIAAAAVMSAVICVMFFPLAVSCAVLQQIPTLEEAEKMVNDGPEVMASIARMNRDATFSELEKQRMGAKYFLNAGIGYSDEPKYETSDEHLSYTKFNVAAGLSFPLFGTWNKEKVNVLMAEINAAESKYRKSLLYLNNLTAIRKAYITLWGESQKIAYAEKFLLSEEESKSILSNRQTKGLVLPADRLEAMAGYEMARRDIAVSRLQKTRALQIVRLATGHLWDMPVTINVPTLPEFSNASADVYKNPSVNICRENVKRYQKLVDATKHIDRAGTLNVGVAAGKDIPGDFGTGVYASINLTEPLKTLTSSEDKAHKAAVADLQRSEYEELFTRIRVRGSAEEAMMVAEYASANINAQSARLTSMAENVREKQLRYVSLPGDTFERLQSSRYQYYRVAMDMIDSEIILMQAGADILSYAYPSGAASEPGKRYCPINNEVLRSKVLSLNWLNTAREVKNDVSVRKHTELTEARVESKKDKVSAVGTYKTETENSVSKIPWLKPNTAAAEKNSAASTEADANKAGTENNSNISAYVGPVKTENNARTLAVQDTTAGNNKNNVPDMNNRAEAWHTDTNVSTAQNNTYMAKHANVSEAGNSSPKAEINVDVQATAKSAAMPKDKWLRPTEPSAVNSAECPASVKSSDTYSKSRFSNNYHAAVYIWDASPVFENHKRVVEMLNKLRLGGYDHLLLSFNTGQIQAAAGAGGAAFLSSFLSDAKEQGIRVDLLLGDPSWIYPEHRSELTSLIKKMSVFNFDGIHLDMEPDSLKSDKYDSTQLLGMMAQSVKAAASASHKPVAFSVHPRYMLGGYSTILNKELKDANVEYISVMMYSSNSAQTSQRMSSILNINKSFNIMLAQSVEKTLDAKESYFSVGAKEFRKKMTDLSETLNINDNFKGIAVQSWEDYGRMHQ